MGVLNPSIHHAVVFEKTLRCGVRARVQWDGLFLFDFSSWPLAPIIVIPGYSVPINQQTPFPIPSEHTRAEEVAEAYAVLRAQVMNVHQVCLTTSEKVLKRRAAMMGFPVTAWNTHKAITFDTPPSYADDSEDIHALAHNVLNNKDQVKRALIERRTLELDVVNFSFDLLDQILGRGDTAFIQLVEAAYMASCRYQEKRFGEATILAWGVCEQLISADWNRMLDEGRNQNPPMPRERRKKLNGRDYTASVMVEMLEINGRIDRDLYRLLEISRKARNNWAHEMRMPKASETSIAIRTIEKLLSQNEGISLSLQLGGRGGVPQWPVSMWEAVKARGGP